MRGLPAQMLPSAQGETCVGQGWPGARECERAERVCARARARACARRRVSGGCRRGSFVEGTCGFRASLAPPLAGATRTPGSSSPSPAARTSLGGRPRAARQPAGARGSVRAGGSQAPGPRAGEGERRGAPVGARRGRGRAGQGVLPLAAGAGRSPTAALLPEAAAAPRPAPPCPLALPGGRGRGDPGRGGGARRPRAAGSEERGAGAGSAGRGECELLGRGWAIAAWERRLRGRGRDHQGPGEAPSLPGKRALCPHSPGDSGSQCPQAAEARSGRQVARPPRGWTWVG